MLVEAGSARLLNYAFSRSSKLLSDEFMNPKTAFEENLNQQNEEAWSAALATLLRSIHEVDRHATQIWFAFYPLSLFSALAVADDREKLARQLLLQGNYDLKNQIDSSHRFL